MKEIEERYRWALCIHWPATVVMVWSTALGATGLNWAAIALVSANVIQYAWEDIVEWVGCRGRRRVTP